jgi:hypothetical protein
MYCLFENTEFSSICLEVNRNGVPLAVNWQTLTFSYIATERASICLVRATGNLNTCFV